MPLIRFTLDEGHNVNSVMQLMNGLVMKAKAGIVVAKELGIGSCRGYYWYDGLVLQKSESGRAKCIQIGFTYNSVMSYS